MCGEWPIEDTLNICKARNENLASVSFMSRNLSKFQFSKELHRFYFKRFRKNDSKKFSKHQNNFFEKYPGKTIFRNICKWFFERIKNDCYKIYKKEFLKSFQKTFGKMFEKYFWKIKKKLKEIQKYFKKITSFLIF